MTGLEVVEVNMHVEDVMTRAEFEAKKNRTTNKKKRAANCNKDKRSDELVGSFFQ